jgi:predicted Fe-Mo cluster-binding NifX family protein
MRIAVAALKKKEDSEIATQAGRAPFYLVFDDSGTLVETLKNPFSKGGGGAGFGVAKMLADSGIDTVVAGKFGQNMQSAFRERGLVAHEKEGTALDAVRVILGK